MPQKGKPKGGPRPGAGMPKGYKTAKVLARETGQREALVAAKETAKLTAQRVIDELALHSFANVQDLFDAQGNLRPIHELTREQAASIASFEIVKKNMTAGDGQTDTVAKVKVIDKTKTIEMLAKHFALLTDVVRVEDADALMQRLTRGRARVAKDTK